MSATQESIDTSTIEDKEWCDAIINNIGKEAEFHGIRLPGYPDRETQCVTTFLGADESMMRGAFQLYKHVKDACAQHSKPIDTDTKILDFGCGWGRIARFFLKDASLENLHGVEVLQELATACNETFQSDNFTPIKQNGKLEFENDKFDVVFANSVFSHLDEPLNMKWIKEIHRVLKPGGIAALTVIDLKKYDSMLKTNTDWMKKVGADTDVTRQEIADGKFVWKTTNRQGELEGYGLTFIPIQWILANWTHLFELKEAKDDYSQCVLILKKK